MKLNGFNISPTPKRESKGFYQSSLWKKIREHHLAIEPLCRICDENGKVELATTVDHILQRSLGGSDYDYNLRSLCYSCHQKVSAVQGAEAKFQNNPKWVKK